MWPFHSLVVSCEGHPPPSPLLASFLSVTFYYYGWAIAVAIITSMCVGSGLSVTRLHLSVRLGKWAAFFP